MSHTLLAIFAPIDTLERRNDPAWNREGRCLYMSNALRFKPGVTEVPLLVDHDDDDRIGTVTEISRVQWDGPWWAALATIDETPPSWLRRYSTKVSFRISTYARGSFTDCELVMGALVSEVSVLTPGTEPAEPLARVLTLRRSEPPRPTIRRAPVSVDPYVRQAQEAAARKGLLYRPGIGQITAVGGISVKRESTNNEPGRF